MINDNLFLGRDILKPAKFAVNRVGVPVRDIRDLWLRLVVEHNGMEIRLDL